MTQPTKTREELWSFIKDIRFAMFTTRHGENGHLHSRPMTTQNKSLDADGKLWFFMSHSADPVADLASEPMVNLSYADTSKDRYVSVAGKARAVEDRARVEALWSPMAKAWFPGGVSDPDLCLVEVQISHANYWDVKESKLTQLFEMAAAVVKGEQPKHMGDTGEVRFDSQKETP